MIKDCFTEIITGFGNLAKDIGNFFSYMFSFIGSLFSKLNDLFVDIFSFLFIPTDDDFQKNKDILFNAFNHTFGIVGQVKEALMSVGSDKGNVSFTFNFLNFGEVEISLAKFEPLRNFIRNGLSVIFWVGTAFSIFRMFSNIFGISVNNGAQGVYKEHVESSNNFESLSKTAPKGKDGD